MSPSPNGGDLLVHVLRTLGTDTVFGVVSVHNLPLVEAVDRELRFVPVRHEASAVNAADAYGRARHGIGCALTSTGTGAGNAAGSLIEALSAGAPVLHITGQIESAYLGQGRGFIHETKDQLGMLTAVSRYAATIGDAEEAAKVLREAAVAALTAPYGPASVEWPIDLQFAAQKVPRDSTPLPLPAPGAYATDAQLDAAAGLLAHARRPLVWAGGGARDAGSQLSYVLDELGAGLLTSNSGRGVVPERDERVVGNFAAGPLGGELLADADALLTIGTHFRSNETRDYALTLPRAHVQIDVDEAALGRSYPAEVTLHGDAATVLRALLPRIVRQRAGSGRTPDPAWRARISSTRTEVRARLRENIGPQAAICAAIEQAAPGAVIARDVTVPSSSWGNRLLEINDPRDNVFPRGGGIGQGLGMGIGAALARPESPVVVMAGDGGLAVHLGELLTLAQERPHLTLVVFNDGGYGVLRNMQDSYFTRRSGVDLATPDFAALAEAAGLRYARIGRADDALPVLVDAVDSGGPVLVEVDLAELGPMKTPFTPPVRIPGQ